MQEQIEKIVLERTNKEGRFVYGDNWMKVDKTDLQGNLGLLILAGVYRSNKEATSSLWHTRSGRANFHATMPLKKFHIISRVIAFYDRDPGPAQPACHPTGVEQMGVSPAALMWQSMSIWSHSEVNVDSSNICQVNLASTALQSWWSPVFGFIKLHAHKQTHTMWLFQLLILVLFLIWGSFSTFKVIFFR